MVIWKGCLAISLIVIVSGRLDPGVCNFVDVDDHHKTSVINIYCIQ